MINRRQDHKPEKECLMADMTAVRQESGMFFKCGFSSICSFKNGRLLFILSQDIREVNVHPRHGSHSLCPVQTVRFVPASFWFAVVRQVQNRFESVQLGRVIELPVQHGSPLFQQLFDDHLVHVVVQNLL